MIDSNFFKNNGPFSLSEIKAKFQDIEIIAPKNSSYTNNVSIENVANLTDATDTDLTFFDNVKYLEGYKNTKALVCIVNEKFVDSAPAGTWLIVTKNPYAIYAQISQMFYREPEVAGHISKTAIISAKAKISPNCVIGDYVVIEDDVEIGDYSTINSFTHIKKGVKIGKRARINSHVSIEYTIAGDDLMILPGAKIGQDGFGFATDKGVHHKVPQLGRVVIGNNVEIGANTTIDRGSLKDTVIGDYVRIDNLVQIAHNVHIGKGSIIVSQVGISGSTEIGEYCAIGGQAGLAGHIKIGNFCRISAQSGLMRDLAPSSTVGGSPAVDARDWHRQTVTLNNLIKKN